jgi:hypothetical protein
MGRSRFANRRHGGLPPACRDLEGVIGGLRPCRRQHVVLPLTNRWRQPPGNVAVVRRRPAVAGAAPAGRSLRGGRRVDT